MKSQAEEMIGQKVLIILDCWIFGPDGRQYRAVYGTLHGVFDDKETLGIKTNAKSTNWYVQVGRQIIAGCQVHYAANVEGVDVNFTDEPFDEVYKGQIVTMKRQSKIYNADF